MAKQVTNQMIMASKDALERGAEMSADMLKSVGISPEHFKRVAWNALSQNPFIASCSPASLKKSLLACAESGLMPDGQQAAIVPYKGEATLVKMVGGLLDLARRSLPGIAFEYGVVYAGDQFEHEQGLESVLRHRRDPEAQQGWDNIRAAWALAHIPGATRPEFVVLYRNDLAHAKSHAQTQMVWTKHPDQMALKTALKALCKRLPTRNTMLFDDGAEMGDPEPLPEVIEVEAVEVEEAAKPAPKPKPKPAPKPEPEAAPAPVEEEPPAETVEVDDDALGF